MKSMSVTSNGKITNIEIDSLKVDGFYRTRYFSVNVRSFYKGLEVIVELNEYTGFGAIENVVTIKLQGDITKDEELEFLNRAFSCYGVVISIKK